MITCITYDKIFMYLNFQPRKSIDLKYFNNLDTHFLQALSVQ